MTWAASRFYAACSFFMRFRRREMPRNQRNPTARKGNRIKQEVPFSETHRRCFHARKFFSPALRTFEHQAHSPKFVAIKLNGGVVLQLAAAIVLGGGWIDDLGQSTAFRLDADLDFQVRGNRFPRKRLHKHEKGARTHIGMRPQGNDAGADCTILDNREGRAVVGLGRRGQRSKRTSPQDRNQFPSR